MSKKRQDAWRQDEDALLADIILSHIQAGKTQLEAFKKAGARLSRTPAACGYRWNASLRQQYIAEIDTARQIKSSQRTSESPPSFKIEEKSLEQAIQFLKQLKNHSGQQLDEDERQELIRLREQNKQLQRQLDYYMSAFKEMSNLSNWAMKQAKEMTLSSEK